MRIWTNYLFLLTVPELFLEILPATQHQTGCVYLQESLLPSIILSFLGSQYIPLSSSYFSLFLDTRIAVHLSRLDGQLLNQRCFAINLNIDLVPLRKSPNGRITYNFFDVTSLPIPNRIFIFFINSFYGF